MYLAGLNLEKQMMMYQEQFPVLTKAVTKCLEIIRQ